MATNNFTVPNFRKQFQNENDPMNNNQFDITKSNLFQQSQKTAAGQLAGETPSFDLQANIARDAFKVQQANSAKQQRELLMGQGLKDTGQFVNQGIFQPAEQQNRARAELERDLAVQKQTLAQQQQQAGQQAAGNLLGMQAGQQTTAQQLQAQKEMQAQQIGSTEKLTGMEIASRQNIATMQNDTERWKQGRTEELTKQGWTFEAAQNQVQREFEGTQNGLDRALNKEIEEGRLSQAEKELAQQASQFKDKLEFDTWATQAGLDNDTANRVWQSSENAMQRTFESQQADKAFEQQIEAMNVQQLWQSGENILNRELERYGLNLEEQKIANQAMQFNDELEWQKRAKELDLNDAEATRIWQSSQNAENRLHDLQMQKLNQEFTEKGINLNAVLSNLQNMPEEQAVAVFRQVASDAGINIPEIKPDEVGSMVTAERVNNILSTKDYAQFTDQSDPLYREALSQVPTFSAGGYYETSGNNQQNFRTKVPEIGKQININGKLYEVNSKVRTEKRTGGHKEYQYFTVIDPLSGDTITVKPEGLKSDEYGEGVIGG